MCTAVSYKVNDLYFGRTFDYEASYGEEIVFMPRKYPFNFRYAGNMQEHFAIIGMAHMAENIPLYYDAMNEKAFVWQDLILWETPAIPINILTEIISFSLNLYHGYLDNALQ